MKTIRIETRISKDSYGDHDGHADIIVYADGEKFVEGHVGGEPEDNSIHRDYSWITDAIEATAKACGATVEQVETERTDDE